MLKFSLLVTGKVIAVRASGTRCCQNASGSWLKWLRAIQENLYESPWECQVNYLTGMFGCGRGHKIPSRPFIMQTLFCGHYNVLSRNYPEIVCDRREPRRSYSPRKIVALPQSYVTGISSFKLPRRFSFATLVWCRRYFLILLEGKVLKGIFSKESKDATYRRWFEEKELVKNFPSK